MRGGGTLCYNTGNESVFIWIFFCIFGIQYMYGKYSSSSLVSLPNEVRTDLWLFSTSDTEKPITKSNTTTKHVKN